MSKTESHTEQRPMRSLATAALLLPILIAMPALAERSLKDGVYSKDQARSGKKLYGEHCIACHERGYFREVLRTRSGETLDPLFEVMVTEMPQNNPGSLSDDEYVDVIAYMLSQSRYDDGNVSLTVSDLGDIRIP
jgi:mono/diheme cytochrome c family protein